MRGQGNLKFVSFAQSMGVSFERGSSSDGLFRASRYLLTLYHFVPSKRGKVTDGRDRNSVRYSFAQSMGVSFKIRCPLEGLARPRYLLKLLYPLLYRYLIRGTIYLLNHGTRKL